MTEKLFKYVLFFLGKFIRLFFKTTPLLLALGLCNCASQSKIQSPSNDLPKSPPSARKYYIKKKTGYNNINAIELMEELGLNNNIEDIGYRQQAFNSCAIQSNRSPRPLCEKLYLGVVNFHIMCRDSTGTVEKVTLEPMAAKRIRWKRGQFKGVTTTNNKGFGSIRFITQNSSDQGHLYLYLGRKVARKRFKDFWKLILPKNWCH